MAKKKKEPVPLPCPWCQEIFEERSVPSYGHSNGDFFVECPTCHACGPHNPTMETACEHWNQVVELLGQGPEES